MRRSLFAFLLIISAVNLVPADEKPRVQWELDDSYSGDHQASFNKLRYEVPILMRQTMIDLSVRCALNFSEGWQIPLVVRFDDQAPFGVENVLAYVQLMSNNKGDLQQQLVINLKAYDRDHFDFDRVFAHELTHAMVNDSLGIESAKLPTWFQEGLAVYGANQGEKLLESYVAQTGGNNLITGLEAPHNALHYLEDYLAFKYIHDRHNVNALHNFIREVTLRKGDLSGALEYTCSESWTEFLENAKKFAQDEVERTSRAERTQTYHNDSSANPY